MRVHPSTPGAEVHGGQSYKRIETIVARDRVLAWNEGSGELSWRPVTQTFVRKADAIYKLTCADGTVVETTWSHPFYSARRHKPPLRMRAGCAPPFGASEDMDVRRYIEGRGWVKAKDLAVGDLSYTAPYVRMMARAKRPAMTPASHSVNEARAVRVAEDPMSGSVSASGSGIVSVEVVAQRFGAETVYNFSVADEHNYFVSAGDVLVHNTDPSYGAGVLVTLAQITKPAVQMLLAQYGPRMSKGARDVLDFLMGTKTEVGQMSPRERAEYEDARSYMEQYSRAAASDGALCMVTLGIVCSGEEKLQAAIERAVASGRSAAYVRGLIDEFRMNHRSGQTMAGLLELAGIGRGRPSPRSVPAPGAQPVRTPNEVVIGKLDDLARPGALKPGERTLYLPNRGNPQANWQQNAGALRVEMSKGRPIRDVSVDSRTGALLNDTNFLRAERNLLRSRGWTYNPSTRMWHPP